MGNDEPQNQVLAIITRIDIGRLVGILTAEGNGNKKM
jgi:hypothetical protein